MATTMFGAASRRLFKVRNINTKQFSVNATKKKADPTGMDVGGWSWQWKAGGGVAVALFTPWCAVKLLQINWESRENLEAVLPSVVQWVRENYGFEDEDDEMRAHVFRMEAMYKEPVTVQASSRLFKDVMLGTLTGTEVSKIIANKTGAEGVNYSDDPTALTFEDLAEDVSALKTNEEEGGETEDVKEVDPLIAPLNYMRSLWDTSSPDLNSTTSSDLIGEEEVIRRQIIQDIVNVSPLSPTLSLSSSKRERKVDDKAVQTNTPEIVMQVESPAQIEKHIANTIATFESELMTGSTGRAVDEIEEDIAGAKSLLRKHRRSVRPWAFWV